jgi:hypothetical protein
MARPLERANRSTGRSTEDRRLARSTARAFAAAFAGLLVTSVVVDQSRSAVDPEGTGATTSFDAATIALRDDDGGRSLVQLADMAPGRPKSSCIEVAYDGSVLPVDVRLSADATGELAGLLDVVVERGSGATFGSCDGFVSDAKVFQGTLAELRTPVSVATVVADGATMSFRFRFEVADDAAAIGTASAADFVWTVRPA